jgi:indole-3-glycerol phosphate synthase
VLDALVQGAREDADARAATKPREVVEKAARNARPVRPIRRDLAADQTIGVIAEVKRASPSKGHLADIPDPVALAKDYEAGGAVAISVLTEGRKFLGSLEDLEKVGDAVSIPVLRKDFITTEYQIVEARAHGADIVLLILACLDDDTATRLLQSARSWGMAVLVETHSREEVERAVALGADIIGVNARDLTTFEVDRELFGRLAPLIPSDVLTIAESAVASVADVRHYREGGANCVLVGEALVTNGTPRETVKEFSQA